MFKLAQISQDTKTKVSTLVKWCQRDGIKIEKKIIKRSSSWVCLEDNKKDYLTRLAKKEIKRCNSCGSVKESSEFYLITKKDKKVLHSKCKDCVKKTWKEQRDKEDIRSIGLRMLLI